MDDHMYEYILNYAECELIPRFQKECSECGVIKKCKSYEEIKALCVVLNAIAPYAGVYRKQPASFL